MKTFLGVLVVTASPLLASGWIPFTQTARIGPAAYDQLAPAVASNGLDYLVGWTTRSPTRLGVYITRVNSDGTLATDVAAPLDPKATSGHAISITPGRDGYFAAWLSENGLNAAITDSYGRVEHRVTVPLDDSNSSGQTLAAWNGAVHLVLSGFAGPFVGTLLDNSGDVLQSNIPIGNTHGDVTTRAALTADSGGFLILSTKGVSSTRDDIYGRRITSSGLVGEWFLVRSVASKVFALSVTSDGTADVIAWGDQFGVWTMELDAQSNVTNASRQLTPDPATIGAVLRVNGRTWITFQSYGKSYAITVGSDGSVTAPVTLGIGEPAHAAWNGTHVLTVRSVAEPSLASEYHIIGSFLSPNAADEPILLSKSTTEQRNGELATDSRSDVVAVWDEKVSTGRQIFGARFDPNRVALDPAGVQISLTGDNAHPAAAFNGTNYLVVWIRAIDNHLQTVARRLSLEGKVLDTDDIVIGDAAGFDNAPRVASDGSNWLVVWVSVSGPFGCGNTYPQTRVHAARVSAAGVLDGGGIAITPQGPMDQREVDLAWTGSGYVAAWTNVCTGFHLPTFSSIGSAVLAADLSQVDVATLSLVGSSEANSGYTHPRVAAGPDRALIAWQHIVNGASATGYAIIGTAQPLVGSRKRAVRGLVPLATVAGDVLTVGGGSNGHFTLLTQMTIPWASGYLGLFETTVAQGSPAEGPTFLFVLEPGEALMGRVVLHSGSRWMAESLANPIFDPAAGPPRLWIREF